jgi:hypothetical protein
LLGGTGGGLGFGDGQPGVGRAGGGVGEPGIRVGRYGMGSGAGGGGGVRRVGVLGVWAASGAQHQPAVSAAAKMMLSFISPPAPIV